MWWKFKIGYKVRDKFRSFMVDSEKFFGLFGVASQNIREPSKTSKIPNVPSILKNNILIRIFITYSVYTLQISIWLNEYRNIMKFTKNFGTLAKIVKTINICMNKTIYEDTFDQHTSDVSEVKTGLWQWVRLVICTVWNRTRNVYN